jgi:hypothetical protein
MIFWVFIQCSSETARHFRGTHCHHLQSPRVSQEDAGGKLPEMLGSLQTTQLICYKDMGKGMTDLTTQRIKKIENVKTVFTFIAGIE